MPNGKSGKANANETKQKNRNNKNQQINHLTKKKTHQSNRRIR